MSAVNTWALDCNGVPIHIDKYKTGIVICPSCGALVQPCRGDKKSAYYRHRQDSSCEGLSVNGLCRMFAKYALQFGSSFTVPSKDMILGGGKFRVTANLEFTLDLHKCSLSFDVEGVFCRIKHRDISIYLTVGGNKVCYVPDSDERFYVVHVRLSELHKLEGQAFEDYFLSRTSFKEVVNSNSLMSLRELDTKSLFSIPNGRFICPASEFEDTVVDSSSCHKCIFYLKERTCLGAGCVAYAVDYTSGLTKQERFDMYSEAMPEPVGIVDYYDRRRIGTCTACRGILDILRGSSPDAMRVQGVKTVPDNTVYAYTKCRSCGKVTPVVCPSCGDNMKVVVNRKNGKVFLCCENYHKVDYDYLPSEKHCNESLTLFTGEPCGENYADELLAVGSVSNYLKGGKMVRKALAKVRNKLC